MILLFVLKKKISSQTELSFSKNILKIINYYYTMQYNVYIVTRSGSVGIYRTDGTSHGFRKYSILVSAMLID